jgi:hypothetical protein
MRKTHFTRCWFELPRLDSCTSSGVAERIVSPGRTGNAGVMPGGTRTGRAPTGIRASTPVRRPRSSVRRVEHRFCDDRGEAGFSWILDEPATRTSHALAAAGRVWIIDPLDRTEAIERGCTLGTPAAVVQLLDRHNRDCAAVARRLGVPHLAVPGALPDTPFEVVEVRRSRRWNEVALWWPGQRTLVVAEAIGTNAFFTGGRASTGVHLLLRLTPQRKQLAGFDPEHLLVGHGVGLHGEAAAQGVRGALARSRRDLPSVMSRLPALIADARRRRR